LQGFNETGNFWTDIRENPNIKFHENPVGTESFFADGRRDMMKPFVILWMHLKTCGYIFLLSF